MTLMELMLAVFVKVFTILYKWLHDYLVINIVNFVKGFEMAIVITVISFLLFNLFLTIKYLRKLPKYYAIEIIVMRKTKSSLLLIVLMLAFGIMIIQYSHIYTKTASRQLKNHFFRILCSSKCIWQYSQSTRSCKTCPFVFT